MAGAGAKIRDKGGAGAEKYKLGTATLHLWKIGTYGSNIALYSVHSPKIEITIDH